MNGAGCYTWGLKSMTDQRIYGYWRPMPARRNGAALPLLALAAFAALTLCLASPLAAQTTANSTTDRIGVGDVVRVEVTGHAELSTTATVDDQGGLTLPTVGTLRAAGRSSADLSADVSRRISLTQRDAPQVRVFIVEARSRKIFVLGSVLLPGAYSFRQDPTVWEAISEAGGTTQDANLAAVLIIPGDASGGRTTTTVDVAAVIRSGAYNTLPKLKPGDTVQVPRSGAAAEGGEGNVIYIMGAISTQGAHGMIAPNDLISTLIRCAPAPDADLERIEIVRHAGDRVVQMKVNARDYLSEAEPNGNPVLLPGDTIYIPHQSRGFGLFTIIGYVSPVIGLATSILLLAR